ncbi:MAG TPA: hypothetical protein VGQ69_02265 [Gemmatimonadales bacterium]|jgi:hypothetical protein|nr:hypothetical protein [Gemmatimonadales bacterium]
MSHLEEGLLHALLDGEVPSPELPPIQAHLASCLQCRERLERERLLLGEADGLVELLEVPAEGSLRPAPKRSGDVHWGRRLAWAASLVGAVGLGYAARGTRAPHARDEVAVNAAESRADSAPVSPAAQQPTNQPRLTPAEPAAPPPRAAANAFAAKSAVQEQAKAAAADQLGKVTASSGARRDTAAAPPATPAARPPVAATEGAARARENALRRLGDSQFRLEEVVVTGVNAQASGSAPVLTPPEPIGFADAIRRLGGSLRLIEGLIPLRLEAQGLFVRVVYATAQGELVLSQQLVDGRVEYRLIAPAGFPADSLARLKARVRE